MKEKFVYPVSAYIPPPNGNLCIDGVSRKAFESFQTLERYKEYRDCGFNEIIFAGEDKYVGEPYDGSNLKKMLDMAMAADLKAVVFDERLLSLTVNAKESIVNEFFDGKTKVFRKYVADCMHDYVAHPAFYGISVADEPKYGKRTVFYEICEAVHSVHPDCFIMTCLLPCIQDQGLAKDAFGEGLSDRWKAYRRYLAVFASSLGYVHYDCYPFGFWEGKNVVAHEFVRNMQVAALAAQKAFVPFHMTIQSFSSGLHDELRRVDEQDLNWQTNLALGFGAKKIYYYSYWRFSTRPSDQSTSAIMDDDGSRIIYDAVLANNKLLQNTAKHTSDYEYVSCDILRGEHENDGIENLVIEPNRYLTNCKVQSSVLANTLRCGDKYAVMVLNLRDPYEKATNAVHLEFIEPRRTVSMIKNGRLLSATPIDNALDMTLSPGEAVWLLDM